MTSFSINSILDLQDTKRGPSPTNRVHKNVFAFEELEEDAMNRENRDIRRSPNSRPALETDNASYEGKGYTTLYFIFPSLFVVCLTAGLFLSMKCFKTGILSLPLTHRPFCDFSGLTPIFLPCQTIVSPQ